VNHENLEPSTEELRRRLQAFIQADISAEDAADETTIRSELEQITGVLNELPIHREPHPPTDKVDDRQSGRRPPDRQAGQQRPAARSNKFLGQRQPPSRFWNDLDEIERNALRDAAQPHTYMAGMHLCYEGDPSDRIIIIEDGWAKITSTTEDGHEVVHAIRGPGDLIGESAVLGHRPRSATIIALSPLRALLVSATRFTTFLDEHPRVWRMVSGTLVRRTDDDVRRLRAQASADGAQRLALLLVDLAEHYGTPGPTGGVIIQPSLSQQELASWVDSSRETVARALKVWRARGLVNTSRRKITVLKPARLRAYTHGQQISEDTQTAELRADPEGMQHD
jgi:CRP-like cAMP-binding protein